ncbi:Zinc finger, RanBP2-type [Corchorus capsularis]|uniref:Zinc finger, RanBP2-type n=1 Tax=Corchorus capsularis TaxID=210143 RepID=A0A1R3HET5_COCAP|nr:Zinc finger, RanBP2-type [Corchorus capsularis]
MAQSPFAFILQKRLSVSSKTLLKPHIISSSSSLIFNSIKVRPFSSGLPHPAASTTPEPPKPTSLSARMSFVFDQIDRIEKQRQEQSVQNDETLQRIRAWRQSKKEAQETQKQFQSGEENPDSGIAQNDANLTEFTLSDSPELTKSQNGDALRRIRAWRESTNGENKECLEGEIAKNEANFTVFSTESGAELGELGKQKGKELEVVHPWPEWIELMERLVQQNYFDHKRRDEEKMVEELGFDMSEVDDQIKDDAGIDFKDFKTVQTACVNFGKDRFDILRSLSRQDIQILVGFGCPSADKKVVFSAKLLRKRVHLDEGDVCSSCSLRNSCERAYLLTNKEDEARTIDVMRVLLTYGFDYVNGSVVNESVQKQKSVKTVVRKLLHQVVKLSAVPIDPNLPPPVIKKPPPKVKQPPPPPKKRVGRDDIEMKKGDWLCPKCDFMNFAKNTVCLQCDAKRPKRQLLPGEWECPECNFLNYRRNMACFHCDCKRPPDAVMEEGKIQEMQPGPRTRFEKGARRPEVSNAWNFDFDDDESDGADVAAFEYADFSARVEASPSDNLGGNLRGLEDDFDTAGRGSRIHERSYSDMHSSRHGMGFDDFDDEDDIDSYEIDTQQNNPRQKATSSIYSENEGFSEPEQSEGSNDSLSSRRTRFPSYNKSPNHMHKNVALSGAEDDDLDFHSDAELSVHPNWKSSHVADTKHRGRGAPKNLSYGSDEDLDLDSDLDDDFGNFRSKGRKENKRSYSKGKFRGGSSDFEDDCFSGSEGSHSRRNGSRRDKIGYGRRENNGSGRGGYNLVNDSRSRSNPKMDDRRNYSDNFDRSHRGSRGDSRRDDRRIYSNDKFDRSSRGSRGDSRRDDRRIYTNDRFDRSSRGPRGDNRRFPEGDYGSQRKNDRQKFMGSRQDGVFENRRPGRSHEYDSSTGRDDPGEFRNSRRVIER